jgi:hypothetical protein
MENIGSVSGLQERNAYGVLVPPYDPHCMRDRIWAYP